MSIYPLTSNELFSPRWPAIRNTAKFRDDGRKRPTAGIVRCRSFSLFQTGSLKPCEVSEKIFVCAALRAAEPASGSACARA
jgi:hypothetical protein